MHNIYTSDCAASPVAKLALYYAKRLTIPSLLSMTGAFQFLNAGRKVKTDEPKFNLIYYNKYVPSSDNVDSFIMLLCVVHVSKIGFVNI